jgi:uncharacterized phiE125 gp8 family phage protein
MKIERILDAKAEAVSLGEARRQCRILGTDDDDTLRSYIEAARNHVETVTRNALIESTYAFYFDEFEDFYNIYSPIVSITSFDYKITDNIGTYAASLTGTDYHLNTDQGLITLADDAMDDLYEQSNAIKIIAVTGQPNIGAVKGDIKLAMLLLIGHWHENREATISGTIIKPIPFGVSDLLNPYRAYRL